MHRPPRHPDPELDQIYFKYNLATNSWTETVRLCVPSRRIRTPVRRRPVGLRQRLSTPPDPVSPVVCLLSTVYCLQADSAFWYDRACFSVQCNLQTPTLRPICKTLPTHVEVGSSRCRLLAAVFKGPCSTRVPIGPPLPETAVQRDPHKLWLWPHLPMPPLRHRSWPPKSIPW